MFAEAADRWSLPVGDWRGVSLRVHASLLAVAVAIVALTAGSNPVGGAVLLAVIVGSAALHEAAHRATARRLHGGGNAITLTPIGGLRLPGVAADPEAMLLVAMVGPLVNLTLVVVSAGALVYSTNNLAEAFAVTVPADLFVGGPGEVALKATLWVNWLTFLANLIPCHPFDAGSALRALLWPMLGRTSAEVFVAQLARVIGWSLVAAAGLVLQASPHMAGSVSLVLGVLGVMVACSAQYELTAASRTPGVTLGGYLETAPSPPPVRTAPSRQIGHQAEPELEESWAPQGLLTSDADRVEPDPVDEDNAVDSILARLHLHGPSTLSDDDRRVLQRASRRYRERRG